MQIPCKAVSPYDVYLVVIFSSLLASSFAVSPEDKKWLLDTLLSLRHEIRQVAPPTFSPQWDGPDPMPMPTPTQWISADHYGYPVPTIAFPSVQTAINKRAHYGLLCCNQPPTRPPRSKRPRYITDSRWRNLVLNAIAKSFSDHSPIHTPHERSQPVQETENQDHPYLSYFDAAESSEPEVKVQRRGVTVVKGGISGINTGFRRG